MDACFAFVSALWQEARTNLSVPVQKTAVAVAHCKRGKGLIKLNGGLPLFAAHCLPAFGRPADKAFEGQTIQIHFILIPVSAAAICAIRVGLCQRKFGGCVGTGGLASAAVLLICACLKFLPGGLASALQH